MKVWTSNWCQGLFPNPYVNHDLSVWPVSEAVDLGEALASLWRWEGKTTPDKRQLIYANLNSEDRKVWRRHATASSDHVAEALRLIRHAAKHPPRLSTGRQATKKENPDRLFTTVTLLTKLWIEGKIDHQLAARIRESLTALLDVDLAILPTLWKRKGNQRSRTLRLPCSITARNQIVLDALCCMSLLKDRWKEMGPRRNRHSRACLFDLDGTLIQSSGLRQRCLKRAFLALLFAGTEMGTGENRDVFPVVPQELPWTTPAEWRVPKVPVILNRCEEFYSLAIYDRHKDWSRLLGAYPYYGYGDLWKDFRQVWNHPLSYPVFVRVVESCLTARGFTCSPRPQDPASVLVRATCDECYDKVKAMLINKEEHPTETLLGARGVAASYRDVAVWEAQFKRSFQAATTKYWEVEYEALPGTQHLLRVLRDVLSVGLYIATEGHHETQLAKLRRVGLDAFFPECCTLSTGAASTPTNHVQNISEEIGVRLKDIESLENQLKGMLAIGGNEQHPEVDKVKDHIQHKREEVTHVQSYRQLWVAYAEKELCAIYSLIVSCIMANPDNPLSHLVNIRDLELVLEGYGRIARSLSFAMIGDRESKDIQPLLQCWNESPLVDTTRDDPVTTIRLLTRDHQEESLCWLQAEELNAKSEPNKKPLARFVAWNLSQVVSLLAASENWPRPQGSDTLPPIMRKGLLITPSGMVDGTTWSMMAWGEATGKPTFALMNRILTRCSIQGRVGRSKQLADALGGKLEQNVTSSERA